MHPENLWCKGMENVGFLGVIDFSMKILTFEA